MTQIDHLVYASPDLEVAMDQLEALLGIRPAPGGHHPAWGTRNALIALGEEVYLEAIGPDPEHPSPLHPLPFGIDKLGESRLVTWAVKGAHLEQFVDKSKRHGVDLGEILSGSRCHPDGMVLSWKLTDPSNLLEHGIIPFFISWGETSHPAQTLTPCCSLVALRAEHPDPQRIQAMLASVGVELQVAEGPAPALFAMIRAPRGMVELR